MTENDRVILISKEEARVEISRKAACQSKLMESMLLEEPENGEEIPLLEVPTNILHKVVEFLNHHMDDPMAEIKKPIPNSKELKMDSIVGRWDADFIDAMESDQETLFKVILAANFLEIEPLLDLGTTKVAVMIQNCKDINEVKQLLKVESDLTPEEERKVREENPWIFDIQPTSNN